MLVPSQENKWDLCNSYNVSGDVIGQISQCELIIEDNIFPQVVDIGKVYQEVTTLHNISLSPNVMKVTVEKYE